MMFFCIFFAQAERVQGLNYEPLVHVGDELIWKVQTTHSNNSIDERYIKHVITSIHDVNDVKTEVNVNSSSSIDNINYHQEEENTTYGILEDYSDYPIYIISRLYHYIVPKTKIGDYIGYILAPTPYWDIPIDTIERGYGIQFTYENDDEITLAYIKEGILEKYEFFNASLNQNYDQNLYSINGEQYSSKTISGYSIWMLLGWCGVIFTVILIKHLKKN